MYRKSLDQTIFVISGQLALPPEAQPQPYTFFIAVVVAMARENERGAMTSKS